MTSERRGKNSAEGQVLKVLVIDDDRGYRDYLTRLLNDAGYAVTTATNGSRVEAIVTADHFDAVVTDLYMPEADGIETIGRIRQRLPHIPIIGLCGDGGGTDDPCSRAMLTLGALAVFEKPLDGRRLLETLADAIAHGATTPLLH